MTLPIRSMTGYATAQSTTEDGTPFSLTFKSVNHRFLDLSLRLPSDCDALDAPLRRLIKQHIQRGHVDATLHVDRRPRDTGPTAAPTVALDRGLLATHIRLFHEAAKLHHLNQEPSLHELLRLPGVLAADTSTAQPGHPERSEGSASLPMTPEPSRTAALQAAVLAFAPSVLDSLNAVRATEGAALAAELHASMLRLRTLAAESTTLRAGAREAHLDRLRTRLADLLGASRSDIPDQRLLAEAALLAERSDIDEELVRLRAHIDSFLDLLEAGGELGKRLDFLLQELNREANTMLSKTTGGDPALGLRLTTLGLEIKSEIERAREQVQNLE